MPTACLPASSTRHLADCLTAGLRVELDLTPKPGLVDRRDSGSHPDLTYAVMDQSIAQLGEYFADYAVALEADACAADLRRLGMAAEARMSAQFGTNTHRGAIFLGGLLLTGLDRAASGDAEAVSRAIGAFALELFADRLPIPPARGSARSMASAASSRRPWTDCPASSKPAYPPCTRLGSGAGHGIGRFTS
jgi:triphosphoribosyl-dephospho-CoA synthetase